MPNRRLGAGQRAKPATRGGYLASGTRGRSPWCSPPTKTALESARKPLSGKNRGRAPLHGVKPPDALRALSVRQRASGNERGRSASGSAQECRALRSADKRGTERVLQPLPLDWSVATRERSSPGRGETAKAARSRRSGDRARPGRGVPYLACSTFVLYTCQPNGSSVMRLHHCGAKRCKRGSSCETLRPITRLIQIRSGFR